ncbi:GlsB/YeaQ/YmgE family stress response membrane protein [Novosphingobium lentum]|uniref:GlsB/YeaQ/YmgE family stress response membrane protein n=1 Tax=Novosphingobium lentum TaxID=145287 RepID=UPI000835883C|nr:GlsB/YeaQ/YmgE family stress response membrane protein [Novosphingobium lentum]
MINLISIIFSGAVIGVLARFFYPGAVHLGWISTIGLGIAGSLLAGLITTRGQTGGQFHRAGCLASIIGAVVLIFLGRVLGLTM